MSKNLLHEHEEVSLFFVVVMLDLSRLSMTGDIVYGEPVETRFPIHSPLLKSIKVIEKQFISKGKYRSAHKAKLYYLRKRNPSGMTLSLRVF